MSSFPGFCIFLALVTLVPFAEADVTARPIRTSKERRTGRPAARLASTDKPSAASTLRVDAPKVSPISYGGSVGYGISSDFANERDPRSYRHSLSGGLGFSFNDTATGKEILNAGLGISGQYQSVGREIEERHEVVELADLSVSLGKTFGLGEAWQAEHSLDLSAGATFPSSTTSQYEGVTSVLSGGVSTSSKFGSKGRYRIGNSLGADYIVNTYTHSPASGEVNQEAGVNYGLSLGVKISKIFSASIGGSAGVSQYTDSTQTLGFGNSQSISMNFKNVSASLKHSNGSHFGKEDIELWYIDEYRRILSFSLSYGF